jgi:hypothetical protein
MPSKSIPEPWRSFLLEIDSTLGEDVELHCLGGFVITVLFDLTRPTADVDVIAITPRSEIESLMNLGGQGSPLYRKHKVYLQLVGVASVPDDYEERLTEMFPGTFKHLRLLALDPYDLAHSNLSVTPNATGTMLDILHERSYSISMSCVTATRRNSGHTSENLNEKI